MQIISKHSTYMINTPAAFAVRGAQIDGNRPSALAWKGKAVVAGQALKLKAQDII